MNVGKKVIFFAMRVISVALFPSVFTTPLLAQEDWNKIPWTVVGDSSELDPGKKLIITGTVNQREDGSRVLGASISADLFKHFDYSDQDGRYVLEMPPGRYKITIRHVGLKPKYLRVLALSDGLLDIMMTEGSIELEELVISSRAIDSNIKQSLTGLTRLDVQEIKTLPTLMGEVDIVKSLQLMPGVSSVGEGSSGFNVRGGRTDQNLILINDVPVFNTSHALGFVSAFNQDIIRDFSLYKGSVPAQLGGRASSVLEITTRRGDLEEWHYEGGAGPISSRFTVEGPIAKGTTSMLLAGRLSYADWFLRKVSDPNVKNSSAFFSDGFASLSHRFSENSATELIYYGSHDDFSFSNQFGYSWNTQVVSAKWEGLANKQASPLVLASYGHFESTLIDPSGFDASRLALTMNYFKVRAAVSYVPNEQHNAVGGVEATAYNPRPEKREPYDANSRIRHQEVHKSRGTELAFFANDEFKFSDNLSLSMGFRYSLYAQLGADTVYRYVRDAIRSASNITDTLHYGKGEFVKQFGGLEPRISLRVSIAQNQSVKVSYNRMRQYIHQISNTTAPTPVDLWQVSNEYLPPQVADNYSIGYFLNLGKNRWETSAEFFYKNLENLVEYKDFPSLYLNPHLETELVKGTGRAYGAELYARKIRGKWTGWISYTYSQTETRVSSVHPSESINNGEWFPANYNKPHTVNVVINRSLMKKSAFSLIVTFNTGRPLTAIENSYTIDGTVVPVYSDRNKYKIPNYIRVDFSLTIGNVIRKLDDSLVFSIYNLLGRRNAYSVFYQRPQSNYFIPVAYRLSVLGAAMPSITYNFRF